MRHQHDKHMFVISTIDSADSPCFKFCNFEIVCDPAYQHTYTTGLVLNHTFPKKNLTPRWRMARAQNYLRQSKRLSVLSVCVSDYGKFKARDHLLLVSFDTALYKSLSLG